MRTHWPLCPSGQHVMHGDDNKEKKMRVRWEAKRSQINAIDAVERAGMKKRWKVTDISTVGTTMKMAARGVQEASYDNSVDCCYAMPVSNPVFTASTGGGGGAAYKSMSWSTSSRERAKLGRLDSEPPLLLREWPPETGRTDKEGRQRGGDEYRRTERGGEAEEWESQQANKAVKERSRKREKRERQGRFTHLPLELLKHDVKVVQVTEVWLLFVFLGNSWMFLSS